MCMCVRVCVLQSQTQLVLLSSEIKACASGPLGVQCNGTTRLKLTCGVAKKGHRVCVVVGGCVCLWVGRWVQKTGMMGG